MKWIREQLHTRDMLRARDNQLEDLKSYEREINTIDPHAHVSVINDADLEGPPRQMQVGGLVNLNCSNYIFFLSISMPTKLQRGYQFLMTLS